MLASLFFGAFVTAWNIWWPGLAIATLAAYAAIQIDVQQNAVQQRRTERRRVA